MVEQHIIRDGTGIRRLWSGFTGNTTFHGISHIARATSIQQRVMWIMVVLACTIGVILQIVDRVDFFNSRPINVNVMVNYNHTLRFPATTLCNQNAFKATTAADHGLYRLIEDLFSTSNTITTADLKHHQAENVTLQQLYQSLAHDKHDLILGCEWNKRNCSADDFVLMLTDHGVCYTFKENGTELKISSSGVESGLRLTLNVEQYEYMAGPHDAAGVKILMHDPEEVPAVHGLGQAIPTGTHAFVGVKLMMINNLPKPHGACDHKRLRHQAVYTTEECYLDCLQELAASRCGCRDIYMHQDNDYPPFCTLEQTYNCLLPVKDEFNERLRAMCDCPVPCKFTLFEPSLSYATLSNRIVDKLFTDKETEKLEVRLLRASDVNAKMDTDKLTDFQGMINALLNGCTGVTTLVDGIAASLAFQENQTQMVFNEMKDVYTTKERLYRFQEYCVKKNFLRGREAMEERILRNVPSAYAEFGLLVTSKIRRLLQMNESLITERDELYVQIKESLDARTEITQLAQGNISVLIGAFVEGVKIFDYKFEDIDRSHNPYIVPKPLLNYSMHHNAYMHRHVRDLNETSINCIVTALEWLLGNASLAYENNTMNETELNHAHERYYYCVRMFMFSKSVVYKQGVALPMVVLEKRHSIFDDTWGHFVTMMNSLNQTMAALRQSLNIIRQEIIPSFYGLIESANRYMKTDNISLSDLAGLFSSNTTVVTTRRLDHFFQEVHVRGQFISDTWTLLEIPTHKLWNMIINDEDMTDYYDFTNNTRFLQNVFDVLNSWDARYDHIRNMDIRDHFQHKDQEFFTALDDITNHLETFQSSIKIDSNFVRRNILQLDIFYKQLSYEQIEQQKSYDFFALICDIGGAMGLFIGASMLTVAEIIDFLFLQIPLFVRHTHVNTLRAARAQKQEEKRDSNCVKL